MAELYATLSGLTPYACSIPWRSIRASSGAPPCRFVSRKKKTKNTNKKQKNEQNREPKIETAKKKQNMEGKKYVVSKPRDT